MDYVFAKDKQNKPYLKVALSDFALITTPLLNKGTAFSVEERNEFNLTGILPPNISTIDLQLKRTYEFYKSKPSDIEKYIYLRDLQDSNETLFYRFVVDHIEEVLPIVYTPTVGLGCERFSHIYRRPRGVFISYPDLHRIDEILANKRFNNVKVIVASDGERILGLGDQGAGGMGIPIGKLALYCACAGIYPDATLPVLLDTGTNNTALQNDPLYIGWHHERIRGAEYEALIDAFVTSVKKRFPSVLLQWEDFAQANANPILSRYQDQLCTFNDDIQGTAAVAAGTLFAAIKITGIPLQEQKIVVVGSGSAGCGISHLLLQAMVQEGLSTEEAAQRFFLIDKSGLILDNMCNLADFQKGLAQRAQQVKTWKTANPFEITLEEVIHNVRPTVLIGVSGQPHIFTEDIIREMAKYVERPIIFPLSNPTERAEGIPAELLKWTEGRAIIGTGSPFPPVEKKGRLMRVDQTNNSYIFPGLGLGLIAVKAQRVTQSMLMKAALTLAKCSPAQHNPDDNLLPSLTKIREVSYAIGVAVAEEAVKTGLAGFVPEDIPTYIKQFMWWPEYWTYKRW